jgi:hypothetical protein
MFLRVLALSTTLLALCYGDTITLRDGRAVSGSFLGGDARHIRMVIGDHVQVFSIADVAMIQFGNAQTSVQTPPAPSEQPPPPPPPPDQQQGALVQRPPESETPPAAPDSPPPPAGWELPAGTEVVVSMIDPVDSQTDSLGQTYRASLAEPLVGPDGNVLVPRGSDVVVKLVADQQSGKIEGKTILTLDLQSITIDGQPVPVSTGAVSQASESRTGKSGKIIGGTAALGAIIGAIAGGGKGAAIGAVSGGAAGTAVQLATKGEHVKVPSETRLTFTLQHPLRG